MWPVGVLAANSYIPLSDREYPSVKVSLKKSIVKLSVEFINDLQFSIECIFFELLVY